MLLLGAARWSAPWAPVIPPLTMSYTELFNASPTSSTYAGAKLIFHATYAKTIHQLTPPAIVAETSSVESDGINTFDATTTYFDNTNITFDKV